MVLVLLIIFMVVTPMLQRGKDVHLPKAQTSDEGEARTRTRSILSVTQDKKIYLEKDDFDDAEPREGASSDELRGAPGPARCCSRATSRSPSATCAR